MIGSNTRFFKFTSGLTTCLRQVLSLLGSGEIQQNVETSFFEKQRSKQTNKAMVEICMTEEKITMCLRPITQNLLRHLLQHIFNI